MKSHTVMELRALVAAMAPLVSGAAFVVACKVEPGAARPKPDPPSVQLSAPANARTTHVPSNASGSIEDTEIAQATTTTAQASADTPATKRSNHAADFSTPEGAMEAVRLALRDRNVAGFLAAFSRDRRFVVIDTAEQQGQRTRTTYAALEAGMDPDGDYLGVMFGGDGGDNLRQFVIEGGEKQPWPARGRNTFVSPIEYDLPVFIRFVREKQRYVVAEIAFPF